MIADELASGKPANNGREESQSGGRRDRDATPPWTTRASVPWLWLSIVLGFGSLGLIWLLARPMALVFLAVTLAETLRPIVRFLARKLPRALAVIVVYLALLLLLAVSLWLVVPMAIKQGQEMLTRLPSVLGRVRTWGEQLTRKTGISAVDASRTMVDRLGDYLLNLPLAVGSALLEVAVVMFLSLYWLLESPRLWPFVASLLPERLESRVGAVARDLSNAIGGYLRGTAIDAAIMGTAAAVALALAGIQYPILLGVIAALGELVPYIGPIVAGAFATLVGLLQSPGKALIAAVLFVVLQQVEGQVLTPTVMRSQTDVSATLVIIALLAGGALGGVVGALAAVPLAATVRTLIVEVAAPALRARRQGRGRAK